MVSPSPGLGANDPQGNRRTAGLGIPGSSSVGGLSGGGSFSADTSGLKDLRKELQGIVGDITALDKAVKSLSTSLTANSGRWSSFKSRLGGGSGGGGGSTSMTTAGFSTPPGGSAPTPGGAPAPGGSGGGNRNTPAPITAFGGGRTLALAAAGEVGAQWAGGINRAFSNFQGGSMPTDLIAAQTNGIFGGGSTKGTANSFAAAVPNLSAKDLSTAYAMLQQNNFLYSKPGSKSSNNLQKFLKSAQGLNPTMGATGAMQFANDLTSNQMLNFLASRSPQGAMGGGLFNAKTGGVNSAATTYKTVLKAITGMPNLTGSQAKGLASNGRSWQQVSQNAAQAGLSGSDLLQLRQYAASGMNLGAATKAVSGTVATSALSRTSAGTKAQTALYEGSAGAQNAENKLAASASNAAAALAKISDGADNLIFGLSKASSAALSLVSKAAETGLLLKGLKAFSSRGGGAAAGAGEGGASGAGAAAEGTTTAAEVTGGAEVTASGVGASTLGAAALLAAPLALPLIFAKNRSLTAAQKKAGDLLIPGGRGMGPQIMNRQGEYIGNNGKVLPGQKSDPSLYKQTQEIGDPVTGSTTTQGLDPAMKKRMSAMMAANPSLKINSGHRTTQQQAVLYALKGGKGVASPGHSMHQLGKAADVGPPSQYGWLAKNASKFGLGRPDPGEPWHLQAMGDPASSGASVTGNQVVSKAETWLGTNYEWGGNGTAPGQGVDCSRFVQEVYASLGIQLPRTTYEQCKLGTKISGLGSAQPGDLIFYDYEGPNSHVAIFIGQGRQIAAPETGQQVKNQSVDSGHITQIRRLVGGGVGGAVAAAASAAAGSSSGGGGGRSGGPTTSLDNSFISQVSSGAGWVGSGSGSGSASSSKSGSSAPGAGWSAGGGSSSLSGTLTAKQVYQLALGAGLSPAAARIATGVADVESRFNTSAIDRDSNGTTDYGLWQTNTINGGSSALFDPAEAASKMAALTNKGTAWHAWGPDFGLPGYGVNPSGATGKVAAALAQLGSLGDPSTTSFSAAPGGGSSGSSMVSASGLSRSGRSITINMPVQVVGVSQQDAVNLAQMVIQMIRSDGELSSVSGG